MGIETLHTGVPHPHPLCHTDRHTHPGGYPGALDRQEPMSLTLLPYGSKGQVYRSPMPFSRFDPGSDLLREYKECEISVVVMLVSDEEAMAHSAHPLRDIYTKDGLQVIQMDIRDFDIPAIEELRGIVRLVKGLAAGGRNIVIHCHAGIGRTGLFAACLEREIHGSAGSEAVAWVRKFIPGAVESDSQIRLVNNY
jgi:protein-tyrosine phosphatase